MNYVYYPDYLEHHGILGMKWGVRRYQNEDGTWTAEGRKRRHRQQNAISTGIGLATGLGVGSIGILTGNPVGILGGAALGLAAKDEARNIQRAKDSYAFGGENPYSSIGTGTKQIKKQNKKLMTNSDYLTSLKDAAYWMPGTSEEYKRNSNEILRDMYIKDNKDLHKFMKDNYGDSSDKIESHLKRSMRGLNEASETESQDSGKCFNGQIYNNVINMYSKGWADQKTFNNFYDSALADRASYYLDEYDVSQPHYRSELKAIIDEGDRLYSQNKNNNVGRLDNWFSEDPNRNPEKSVKHYFYTQNYFIG